MGGGGVPRPHIPSERVSWGWGGDGRGVLSHSPISFPGRLRPQDSPPQTHTDPYIPGRLLASWSLGNCPYLQLEGPASESLPSPASACGGSAIAGEGAGSGIPRGQHTLPVLSITRPGT